MPVDTELDTPPKTTAAAPFKQVADETPVDSQSAGYAVMQEMGEQARKEKDKNAAGFSTKAAGEDGAGFSLAGTDSAGNGFSLPLDSPTLLGKKFSGFKRTWYRNDQRTMQFAAQLNPGFDRIIKRAIKNNWKHLGMEVGIGPGRIPAPPQLSRALHRRIQELAAGGPEADKAIKAMGYYPDSVRAQLANMSAHSGDIKDVMESIRQQRCARGRRAAPSSRLPDFHYYEPRDEARAASAPAG